MTNRTLGDIGGRSAPAHGVLRRSLARIIAARETHDRRSVNVYLLGLDAATLAGLGYDRKVLDTAGRGPYPL